MNFGNSKMFLIIFRIRTPPTQICLSSVDRASNQGQNTLLCNLPSVLHTELPSEHVEFVVTEMYTELLKHIPELSRTHTPRLVGIHCCELSSQVLPHVLNLIMIDPTCSQSNNE